MSDFKSVFSGQIVSRLSCSGQSTFRFLQTFRFRSGLSAYKSFRSIVSASFSFRLSFSVQLFVSGNDAGMAEISCNSKIAAPWHHERDRLFNRRLMEEDLFGRSLTAHSGLWFFVDVSILGDYFTPCTNLKGGLKKMNTLPADDISRKTTRCFRYIDSREAKQQPHANWLPVHAENPFLPSWRIVLVSNIYN